MTTSIENISGYRFTPLDNLEKLQERLKSSLTHCGVRGAVVLAEEGVNVTLAGTAMQIGRAQAVFEEHPPLRGIWYKKSQSDRVPHTRLRVRIRKEIVSFDGEDSVRFQAHRPQAPTVSPAKLEKWLDENRSVVLLDTRNDYEIVSGRFTDSIDLNIKHFKHFKRGSLEAIEQGLIDTDVPVITYCTGGIRCEKAAPWLLEQGLHEVYQLEGGIINYLQKTSARYWQGDCFVFDERVELNHQLQPTGAGLCDHCQLAVPAGSECQCHVGAHYHASTGR
ncbi:MAG: hypothetical protein KTR32_00300 [Granulosicoccus sp.]|nr:hypothetical protein [Granulosicoccus sp.]